MAIGLSVQVVGLPGNGDEIERVLAEMASLVRQREPGCIRYDVGRSRDDRDSFMVWEIYVDQQSFDLHRVTVHFDDLMNGRLPTLIRERRRTLYDTIS